MIPILMFVISSNVDNLVLGLSYGLKGIRIGTASNLLVGLITLAGTVLSMGLGKLLLAVLPEGLAETLGSAAVLLIGLWLFVSWLRKRNAPGAEWGGEDDERFDRDRSKAIEPREAVALGLALTVNNMGLGIGASAMGLGIAATSAGSCLCSIICLTLGNYAGRGWVSRFLGRCAEPAAGLLVILMGLYGLFF